jgi:hypothetical protein
MLQIYYFRLLMITLATDVANNVELAADVPTLNLPTGIFFVIEAKSGLDAAIVM